MRPELRPRPRDGFALPLALLAMIIIGAVVTGGFYMSSQEHTVSVSTEMGARALEMAEYGLDRTIATLPASVYTSIGLGAATNPRVVEQTPVMNGSTQLGWYIIRVLPLGGRLYMVESEGQVQRGNQVAIRRVGAFVRTTQAQLPYESAVSVYGKFSVSGNAYVRGEDADGGACGAANATGVVAVMDTLVKAGQGNNPKDHITGDPDIAEAPELNPDKLSDFGDLDLSDIIAMATHRYPGGTNLTQLGPTTTTDPNGMPICELSNNRNWGEPWTDVAACRRHFPVIHAQGNLSIQTGRGQGVLIVDGDLSLTGNMEFYGIVIVRGSFKTSGTGGHVRGSLLVHGNSELNTESTSTGNALVQYASCRVRDAFSGLPVLPLASRSWVADTPPLAAAGQ